MVRSIPMDPKHGVIKGLNYMYKNMVLDYKYTENHVAQIRGSNSAGLIHIY